ncbi:MAG: NAD(P)/FAD-dependent oxidoreductase [Planctomycetes bacterium]|nr:NAD(P)/FAD-dependent oxidoreductase [Planctomycetota bacterium]MCB9934128.1 NAD(P)/FAD-dependent oxidoreductase [Planctomycetota bacterium]
MSRIVIVGGGAAGFFAAITCAEAAPGADVTILEKSPRFLSKVKISGGGRCNVTHACFDARALAAHYPRGERALIGPFKAFQPEDTIEWFRKRGVEFYAQEDGCLFPVSDSSQTIIDCFIQAAQNAGVKLRVNAGVEAISHADGVFTLTLAGGGTLQAEQVLIATGGCRTAAMGQLAVSLGHTLEPPVPSLFTFHIDMPWVRELAGIVIEPVEAAAVGLRERGILLFTHWGVSGPVILRLSAWGARKIAEADYHFPLTINWLPGLTHEALHGRLTHLRESSPAKLVVNTPIAPLTARLWEALVLAAGVARETRWAELSKAQQHELVSQLLRTELSVSGKSMNKDEFVTCGGVRLSEVDFKTMQSRIVPGLYFAGELLDVDGITGGFNFQNCWTTGWLAGNAMARHAALG